MECGIFFISIVLFLIFESVYLIFRKLQRPLDFPPGPQWLIPFIGNSRYVRKLSRKYGGQHKAFEAIAKEFKTPIFSLRLGREYVVVAMTYKLVKEVYTKDEFLGRPDTFFLRLRTMGSRLGITCTDEKFWSEQRSFVVRQLRNIGYGKSIMQDRINEELNEIVDILRNSNGKPVWPGESNLIATSVINILWTFTTGSKIKRNDGRLAKLFDLMTKRSKAFDMSGGLLSQMPWLRFIAPEATGYNLIKDLNSKFYAFFMEFVDEHIKDYSDEKSNDDLIYAFLKEMKEREGEANSTFTIKQLIIVILDIFIGGSQTTSISIDLALMTMILHPEIQKKCHEELDRVVKADGAVPGYNDRHKTPFIEAVILETIRFYSIAPVTGPRRALKTCKLSNFIIPKDTTVLLGLASALNDETIYKDPRTFNPERFLDDNMKVINTDTLIPFATGRRRCLGDQLAKECVYKFFVGILNEFSLHESDSKEDMPSLDLQPGILLSPKPYKIIFKEKKHKIL